jgi:HAD superfamily hydrolase (TIGR01509 family)
MTSTSTWTATPSSNGLAIGSVHMPVVPSWPLSSSANSIAADAPTSLAPRRAGGKICAVVFEPDNVLYDASHWQRWLWQLLSRLGVQRDFAGFRRIWQRGYLVEAQRGTRDFADAFRAFLADWGLSPGQINEVEAASIAKRREAFQNVRPLPGVVKTLATLNESGITLATLANSELTATELRDRINRLGLGGRFQTVLSSHDLGSVKPAPNCYQTVLDALRMAPDSVLYVGCLADELSGATAIGLRTAAINADSDAVADHSCQRFDDLVSLCLPAQAAALA